ncbi:IS66 family insertion sequence element accessory protein TnpA [Undibacterium sp. RuRC25W]|uniref:IS66 family insertion sequence element accessory protein TnpA n=1 Tax=Undibacterium sp. RuRC25W TaxID=3413047 RepID=UPI003BF40A89
MQHVTALQGSGLSQAAYCCEHQLNHSTFHSWISRGQVPTSASTTLTTVPAVIQASLPTALSLSPIVLRHESG